MQKTALSTIFSSCQPDEKDDEPWQCVSEEFRCVWSWGVADSPNSRLLHLGTQQQVGEEEDVSDLPGALWHFHQEAILHQLTGLTRHDTHRLYLCCSTTEEMYWRGKNPMGLECHCRGCWKSRHKRLFAIWRSNAWSWSSVDNPSSILIRLKIYILKQTNQKEGERGFEVWVYRSP